MVVSFVSNFASIVARENIVESSENVSRSLTRLSSGQRVFNAEEDAASLAIGTGLRIDVSALRAAQVNTTQGVSMLQIADGALSRVTEILVRMKSLASQSLSDQVSDVERGFLDAEYQQLLSEIDRITGATTFNGVNLLGGANEIQLNNLGGSIDADDGFVGFEFANSVDPTHTFQIEYFAATNIMTLTNQTNGESQSINVVSPQFGQLNEYNFSRLGVTLTLNSNFNDAIDLVYTGVTEEFDVVAAAVTSVSSVDLQIGTTTATSDRLTVDFPVTDTLALGVSGTDVNFVPNAQLATVAIDTAIANLNVARASLGADMNRLEKTAQNIVISIENSEIARSALLEVDVASEITQLTSQQVLQQSAVEMLRQANLRPQVLLRLLEG